VTDFESIACKVMGLMLVVMLLILYLQLMGCSPPQESTRDFIDEVNMENYA
jgi:hypothetical protein